MSSPFIIEDAVPPERFFDRREEVEFFERMLRVGKRKMLICIVAPLKYGKTSLMLKFLEIVKNYDDIIPIYINLKKASTPIKNIIHSLPFEMEKLEKIYENAKKGEVELDELFDAINKELEKRNKWLFIFFDEFHLLPENVKAEGFLTKFSNIRIFGFFRGFAEGRRISYIVCGSVIEPLLEAIDVWGGRFQIVYLGPFPKEDAIHMLKTLFKEAKMEVPDEVIEEIAEAAGYHPFYMQYLGSVIYSLGQADRRALIEAKKKLWDYVRPIFSEYVLKMSREGENLLDVLLKIMRGEEISLKEIEAEVKLYRMGFIRPSNSWYEVVDPLFARYVEALMLTCRPPEVVVVGHWAERIVGNYLLRKRYYPFYSHDSRGAFDIYVRVKGVDVGIQVKYSSLGKVKLSKEEAERILKSAEEMGWIPLIALVSKGVEFFYEIRAGEYKENKGVKDIEEAIEKALSTRGGG